MSDGSLTNDHARAWEALLRAHGALVKTISSQMASKCPIGLDTYEVLLSLEQTPQGRMTMGELAETVMLSPSGVTRLVDRLTKQELVERICHPRDKRSFHAVLTPKGRKLREECWPALRVAINEHFVQNLTEEEAAQLTGLLVKFVKTNVGARVHL